MLVVEQVRATHMLEHPDKPRHYAFTESLVTGEMIVMKWDGGRVVERRRISVPAARKLYTFLRRKVGYRPYLA